MVVAVASLNGAGTQAVDRLWQMTASRRPRLPAHVRSHPHRYRGQRWFVLEDRLGGRHHRVRGEAMRVIGLMDGERTVAEVLANAQRDGEDVSRPELLALLDDLQRNGLLAWDSPADTEATARLPTRARKSGWLAHLRSPFAIRVRLFNPDELLDGLAPVLGWLFTPLGLTLWLLTVSAGALVAWEHWQSVSGYWDGRGLRGEHLLVLWSTFSALKAVHELAHGLALKRLGGEVREAGVVLLMLMPMPYVDASAASTLASKRQRIVVGAAGVMAELMLAAAAAVVWVLVEPGLIRDLAWATMLLGAVSSVLFNGNPLLRFDGYHVLADAIEIPNLAGRASRYYGYLVKRRLFGLPDAVSPVAAAGERGWFLLYAPASLVYRVFMVLSVSLLAAERWPLVGMVLGGLALGSQLLLPMLRWLRWLLFCAALVGQRARAVGMSVGLCGTLLVLFLVLPAPLSSYAEGVVWLPDQAMVRAPAAGFVTRVAIPDGAPVRAGATLFTSEEPEARARVRVLEWQSRALEAERGTLIGVEPAGAALLAERLARNEIELEQARTAASRLVVVSPLSGTMVVPGGADLPGRYVPQGALLAYVTPTTSPTLKVVVDETQVDLVRWHTARIEVRLADRPWQELLATHDGQPPVSGRRLPSAALGTRGGGDIAVDPGDPQGLQTLDTVFTLELSLPGASAGVRPGTRVLVRLEHPPEPLAWRCYRALRRLLLERLAV